MSWIKRDLAEERAAIIEEGEGCTRQQAEEITAKLMGYQSWSHLQQSLSTSSESLDGPTVRGS